MRTNDETLINRLTRRLKSARGTVFLEFAFLAPLAMALMLFAYDFTTILYCEQQLEIGSRAFADIESHIYHGDRKDVGGTKPVGPGKASKEMVKIYLQKTLGLRRYGDVYVKGNAKPTPGAAQLFTHIHNIFTGEIIKESVPGGIIWKFLLKILGGILKIVTLGTEVYLTHTPCGDRMVRMTCSARVPTFLPRGVYDFWSAPKYVQEDLKGHPKALVMQTRYKLDGEGKSFSWAWNWKPVLDERFRYYCTMPACDTQPVAPKTFVRRVRSWFGKWVPDSAWPSDDN